jgi:NAD(P)H-flavin reductase
MTMGFRGPFGNSFPVDEWKGKNIVFAAGGIALPPMRCRH